MEIRDRLEFIKKKLEELERRDSVRADELYGLIEELLTIIMDRVDRRIASEVSRRGSWNIEMLDEAIDRVSDVLGRSAIPLNVWDEIWEALIDRKNVDRELVSRVKQLVVKIEKKLFRG